MYQTAFLIMINVLFVACSQKKTSIALPYYNEPDFTPLFITSAAEVSKKVNHTLGNFSLLNQDSIVVTEKKIEGKIHVANFIFTKCNSICPAMTNNMKIVSDAFINDNDVLLLSYSVTPWTDKPHVLKRFKKEYKIENGNWHFLTGDKSAIYQLARQSYFAEEDIGFSKDSTEFLHTEHFVLVDKTKRIRGVYNGTLVLEMQQLIDDIKTLQQENKVVHL